MNINFNIIGNLDINISNKIKDDVFHAMKLTSEYLLTEANRTVPLDDGILKASGKTSHDETLMKVAVSYDTPYAVRLHEHPEFDFQGTGRGKWLELTINEKKSEILRLMQKTIEARINQGGGI